MNKKILSFVLISFLLVLTLVMVLGEAERKEYILLELQYSDGQMILIDKSLEKGFSPSLEHDVSKDYEANLLTDVDEVIYTIKFDPTLLYTDGFDEETEGGIEEFEEIKFLLLYLVSEKGKK